MSLKDTDVQILQHILNYCNEIAMTIETFGADENKFLNDFIYRNALSMPILQIGELVKHLSPTFTDNYSEISWRAIVGMRNHFAHGYQIMNFSEVWATAVDDVPTLKIFCEKVFEENNIEVAKCKK